jgi:hypothetical protein
MSPDEIASLDRRQGTLEVHFAIIDTKMDNLIATTQAGFKASKESLDEHVTSEESKNDKRDKMMWGMFVSTIILVLELAPQAFTALEGLVKLFL